MAPASDNLENDLKRITQDAKLITLLSFISIITPPLYLVALLLYIFYFNKRKKLKSDQSQSNILNGLKGKTTKELKSVISNSNSLEQSAASSILAHKTMVTVLIVIGIIIVLMLGAIGMLYFLE